MPLRTIAIGLMGSGDDVLAEEGVVLLARQPDDGVAPGLALAEEGEAAGVAGGSRVARLPVQLGRSEPLHHQRENARVAEAVSRRRLSDGGAASAVWRNQRGPGRVRRALARVRLRLGC